MLFVVIRRSSFVVCYLLRVVFVIVVCCSLFSVVGLLVV